MRILTSRTTRGTAYRTVHLNATDTELFATRPGNSWPASATRGHAVMLYLDGTDLVDYIGPDATAAELDALQDYAAERAGMPEIAKG